MIPYIIRIPDTPNPDIGKTKRVRDNEMNSPGYSPKMKKFNLATPLSFETSEICSNMAKVTVMLTKMSTGDSDVAELAKVLASHHSTMQSEIESKSNILNEAINSINMLKTKVNELTDEIETLKSGQTAIVNNKTKLATNSSQRQVKDLLDTANKQSLVHGLDFESPRSVRKDMIDHAQKKIDSSLPNGSEEEKNRLKRMSGCKKTFPLGKATKVNKNNIHTIPIVIHHETIGEKIANEKVLKKCNLSTSYLWPKQILNQIDSIKELVSKQYTKDQYQTMIRPDPATGEIIIKVRPAKDAYQYLFSIAARYPTPVLDADLESLNMTELPDPQTYKVNFKKNQES